MPSPVSKPSELSTWVVEAWTLGPFSEALALPLALLSLAWPLAANALCTSDGVPAPAKAPSGHAVQSTRVNAGYFDALDIRLLAGRPFAAGDLADSAGTVIVSRTFVERVLGGGNALGRRIRYAPAFDDDAPQEARPERWYEIVGVVDDLHANAMAPELVEPAVYTAGGPVQLYPAFVSVRVKGMAPAAFAGRWRELAVAADPALRLSPAAALDDMDRQGKAALRLITLVLGLITVSVLLLSAAGIYALMSFTVTRRRREIGIRSALGAEPESILRGIFSRAVGQLGLGLGVGVAAAVVLELMSQGGLMDGKGVVLLPAVAVLMLIVFGGLQSELYGDTGFDGRVARLTKTQSQFGVELDSLADVVSFGVARRSREYTRCIGRGAGSHSRSSGTSRPAAMSSA